MSIHRRQRGEGKAGVIFWLLIFLAAGVFGKEWIPAKISDMEFRDHLDQLPKQFPRKNSKVYQDLIMTRAKELDIPLKPKDVNVDKTAKRVRYDIRYVQVLDLIFTTYDWEFKHKLERDIFII